MFCRTSRGEVILGMVDFFGVLVRVLTDNLSLRSRSVIYIYIYFICFEVPGECLTNPCIGGTYT